MWQERRNWQELLFFIVSRTVEDSDAGGYLKVLRVTTPLQDRCYPSCVLIPYCLLLWPPLCPYSVIPSPFLRD